LLPSDTTRPPFKNIEVGKQMLQMLFTFAVAPNNFIPNYIPSSFQIFILLDFVILCQKFKILPKLQVSGNQVFKNHIHSNQLTSL